MDKYTGNRRFWHNNHPVFTERKNTKGRRWNESVFYYWFKAVRRAEDCTPEVLRDFGDVSRFDETKEGFKAFWDEPVFENGEFVNNRGAYLFAEPQFAYDVQRVQKENLVDLVQQFDDDEFDVFTIPKNMPLPEVMKKLKAGLQHKNRGKRKTVSHASYYLEPTFRAAVKDNYTASPQIDKMRKAFECYDLVNCGKPKWRIAWEVDGSKPLTETDTDGSKFVTEIDNIETADAQVLVKIKAKYGVAFNRWYNYACALIQGAEEGLFPQGQSKHR